MWPRCENPADSAACPKLLFRSAHTADRLGKKSGKKSGVSSLKKSGVSSLKKSGVSSLKKSGVSSLKTFWEVEEIRCQFTILREEIRCQFIILKKSGEIRAG